MTSNAFVSHMRAVLEGAGPLSAGLMPPAIHESWTRCLSQGLDPRSPPAHVVDTATALSRARERHEPLRRVALAEMAMLHRLIEGSGHAVALAAPDGMILDTMSDPRFEAMPHALALRPGSVWSEARCGTNGVGTAALTKTRLTVFGHEHYFERYAGLACTAVPIFAPEGALAGVLDASCDRRAAQLHTQALITISAAQIENAMLRERHRGDIVLAVHPERDALRTWGVGLLAFDAGGTLLAANARARAILAPTRLAGGEGFASLFQALLESLLAEARKRGRAELTTHFGARVFATIEMVRALDPPRRVAVEAPSAGLRFIADDAAVAQAVAQVEAAARRKIPILIRGETGTGKEQMARHAHAASGRAGAFVPVNCASLPAGLIEAELFGYVDGAFTGARRGGATGLAKEADGGTLFLDEIGDMPVALQAVLLRFLDDWTVRPVGGSGGKVDVFLVSATNAALDQAIKDGRFRADLLYRLNTLEVALPPLALRSDVPAVIDHLLATIDPDCTMTNAAKALLCAQPWPGNIRQLRNMLARLTLGPHDGLLDEGAVAAAVGPAQLASVADPSLKESQRARIIAAYERAGGNVSETSRRLNVSRNTIYRALGRKNGRGDLG